MKKIALIVKLFLYITACILIICAINFKLYGEETLPGNTLLNILIAGMLTTLVTVFLYPRGYIPSNYDSRKHSVKILSPGIVVFLQILLHYLALTVVMVFCGHRFGWISFSIQGILSMVVNVAGVYFLVFCAHYLIDLKETDAINKKLQEQYRD